MDIKILGTIVSPDYDDDYFAAWIDRGIITPSSRVVNAVESATEPIDLYINSYGGDVFAGGEMQIALIKAAAAKKIRRCEVGSIAASMAANIVAALRANGVDVEGHTNTQLMFHGCYTETTGGAQHHEDVAGSLRNINESVIANLNRIGITDCRAWFAEGREEWIPADRCKKVNLLTSIAETDADAPVEAKHTAARLAAFASTVMSRKEYQMKVDEIVNAEENAPVEAAPVEAAPEAAPAVEEPTPETPAVAPEETPAPVEDVPPAEPAPEEPAAPAEPAAPVESDIEARVTAMANERFAGLQAKHEKKISDLVKERDQLANDLATAKAEVTSRDELIVNLKADLADVRDQLDAEKSAHESVVAAALRPAAKNFNSNGDRIASGMKIV